MMINLQNRRGVGVVARKSGLDLGISRGGRPAYRRAHSEVLHFLHPRQDSSSRSHLSLLPTPPVFDLGPYPRDSRIITPLPSIIIGYSEVGRPTVAHRGHGPPCDRRVGDASPCFKVLSTRTNIPTFLGTNEERKSELDAVSPLLQEVQLGILLSLQVATNELTAPRIEFVLC
jgi:hypothetical protein